MNNRVENELLKNLTEQNSLEDVLLMSSGSAEITNLVLMKIINRQHNLHVIPKSSTSCPILKGSAAA